MKVIITGSSGMVGEGVLLVCLGVTSLGKKMDQYYKVTCQLTMHFGETVSRPYQGQTRAHSFYRYIAGKEISLPASKA
ncbi:MAG: hypothetical protein L0Y37_06765 [Bacteroidales bacterium]|nr:hypothetical protein [Bacteroidales bacterium]